MSKDLKRGGSSKIAGAVNQAGSPGRKNKVVTFKENEIEEEEEEDEPTIFPGTAVNSPPDPPKPKEKLKKGGVDVSELDKGLEKLRRKVSGKKLASTSDGAATSGRTVPYPVMPWEVDPTSLRIWKTIGKGAYGTVYRGTYQGKVVAIKMLDWGDPDPDDSRAIHFQYSFFREVEIMYKLESHPNVCKFLGATMGSSNLHVPSPVHGTTQVELSKMMCCIVMEYIDGGTLRQFWYNHRKSGKRRMPFSVMVQFAIDIAKGLAYLHSKNVIHRDLKPDNILMARDCSLKIADFGISRLLPESLDDAVSLYRGTANYCAPEILDGKTYTHKCDVYSYGISLWEIYSCDVPYPSIVAIETGKVNKAIINENLRPTIPCCCPPEFKRIMTRCWDGNPAKRPEMAEVVQWLERINTEKVRFLTNDTCAESCACIVDVVDVTCGPRIDSKF